MQRINDQKRIHEILDETGLVSIFGTADYPFRLALFDRGEWINACINPAEELLFLVRGEIRITDIRADGTFYEVISGEKHVMLGDIEFAWPDSEQYMIEARSDCLFLTLAMDHGIRERLEKNSVFLMSVIRSLAEKMSGFSHAVTTPANLKERVLYGMETRWNGTLKGTGKAAAALHCSRRQLQRVLADLVKEGKIIRNDRGSYVLKTFSENKL